jgi:predicted ester cyclase
VEESVNQGSLSAVDALLAPSYPSLLLHFDGPQSVKHLISSYRGAIPDARWTIQEQVAERDTVVTYFVAHGTHQGPLWGVPATGKPMAVSGILLSRCQRERIVDQRVQLDLLGLLQQLGVMPELGLQEEVIVTRLLKESYPWMSY